MVMRDDSFRRSSRGQKNDNGDGRLLQWIRIMRGGASSSSLPSKKSLTSSLATTNTRSSGGGDVDSSSSGGSSNSNNEQLKKPVKGMPSVFQPDEVVYDRYAACLAATEALRQTRDAAIQRMTQSSSEDEHCNPIEKLCSKIKPSSTSGLDSMSASSMKSKQRKIDQNSMEYKQANAQYLINASKTIKALGLSIPQFNSLSREVNSNEAMKERVSAYLFKLLILDLSPSF